MPTMLFLIRLLRDRRGTSAVEYGMLLGLMVLVMLVALRGLSDEVSTTWGDVSSQTASATSQAVAGG